MPDYRQYYSAHNRADLGRVSDVDMPDPDVFAGKYRITIGAPEPLPVFDVDSLALPAGLAADIAQRHHDRLAKQLDGAKQAAIEGAQKHMDDGRKAVDRRQAPAPVTARQRQAARITTARHGRGL